MLVISRFHCGHTNIRGFPSFSFHMVDPSPVDVDGRGVELEVLLVQNLTNKGTQELSKNRLPFLSSREVDDHLDDRGVASDNVSNLVDLQAGYLQ